MSRTNSIVAIFIVVIIFVLQTGCMQQAGPTITFENTVLDFGHVRPGANNIGQFEFTNTGKELLQITDVERCCGVAAKLDKTKYEPGQSGVLTITYPSSNTPIAINRTVYVNSNDKKNPRLALTIKAEVVFDISWEPKTIKLSPEMENAGCPKITIESIDGEKLFSIRRLVSSGSCITADIDPSGQATKFVLQPKVDISRLAKFPRGSISINVVYAEAEAPSDTVAIAYSSVDRISLNPRSLYLFYLDPQKPITRTLKVTKNYGEDFDIDTISSKSGHVKVLSRRDIENGYQFELEIMPVPVDERGRFSDTLTITFQDGQKMEVFCRGILSVPDEDEEEGDIE